MSSTISRGNYYKRKTRDWYEKQGFVCQLSEFTCGIMAGRRTFYRKIDLFGSDLICMNGKEIIFANSKATTEDRKDGISKMKSEAKIEFEKYPFPASIKKQVVIWLPKQKPQVFNL